MHIYFLKLCLKLSTDRCQYTRNGVPGGSLSPAHTYQCTHAIYTLKLNTHFTHAFLSANKLNLKLRVNNCHSITIIIASNQCSDGNYDTSASKTKNKFQNEKATVNY